MVPRMIPMADEHVNRYESLWSGKRWTSIIAPLHAIIISLLHITNTKNSFIQIISI